MTEDKKSVGPEGPPGMYALNEALLTTKHDTVERGRIARLLRNRAINVRKLLEPAQDPKVDDEFRDSADKFEERGTTCGPEVFDALRHWIAARLDTPDADIVMTLYQTTGCHYQIAFDGPNADIWVPEGRWCVSNPPSTAKPPPSECSMDD